MMLGKKGSVLCLLFVLLFGAGGHGHGHSHGGHGHSHDGHGHSHDGHGHSHDGGIGEFDHPDAVAHGKSKYLRQFNEEPAEEKDFNDLYHGHGHQHQDHSNGHGGHGHSHGGHGHSHDGGLGDHPESIAQGKSKYLRQFNEEPAEEDLSHLHQGHSHQHEHHTHTGAGGHGHSHDEAGSHGHSHAEGAAGSHGHSHDGAGSQGHSHAEGAAGSHGHSHDGAGSHGHSHAEGAAGSHGHSHADPDSHGHSHDTHTGSKTGAGAPWQTWLEAVGATVLISAAPFCILWFIPIGSGAEAADRNANLLKLLLSFASGGLLGDAFLHLIPHASSPHSPGEGHSHGHSHEHGHSHDNTVGLWVLGGIVAFFVVEKIVRHLREVSGEHGHSHAHGHSHGHASVKEEKKEEKLKGGETKSEEKEKDGSQAPGKETLEIKVAGYLNLVADFFHNFTDGMAIGASFLVSSTVGVVTTLTIFFHEIPHEIGDFAILVQSGFSKWSAMLLQLSTATGALIGCFCGLAAHHIGESLTMGILPFTAGGFIYIATTSVFPELLDKSSPVQSLLQLFMMFVGIGLMVIIGMLE